MASRSSSTKSNSKSRVRKFSKDSKMKRYSIIFDEEIGQNVTGYMNYINFEFSSYHGDQVWKVEAGYEHRMDLISAKFYGTTKFDWILEQINNIRDPIKDITIEKKLIIPTKSRLYAFV